MSTQASKDYLFFCLLATTSALNFIAFSSHSWFSSQFEERHHLNIFTLLVLFLASNALIYKIQDIWQSKANTLLAIGTLLLAAITLYGNQLLFYLIPFSDSSWLLPYFYTVVLGAHVAIVASLGKRVKAIHTFWLIMIVTGIVASGLFLQKTFAQATLASLVALHLLTAWVVIWGQDEKKPKLILAVGAAALAVFIFMVPVTIEGKVYKSQKKFYDKVVFSKKTPFQQVDITEWKGEQWFFQNNINQFSSIDEWLYFEPLVHPAMALTQDAVSILVMGGENGCAVRELLKYTRIKTIDVLPVDPELAKIASNEPHFTKINLGALSHQKVKIFRDEPFQFLSQKKWHYDLVIVDVPDPIDIELNQFFTQEFYRLAYSSLKDNGTLVTQAGSPYFASRAFTAIGKTLESANFSIVPFHNPIPSLGEWGWFIGAKNNPTEKVKETLLGENFSLINTRWINGEAMKMMLSFGKGSFKGQQLAINSLKKPIVHEYYTKGK